MVLINCAFEPVKWKKMSVLAAKVYIYIFVKALIKG